MKKKEDCIICHQPGYKEIAYREGICWQGLLPQMYAPVWKEKKGYVCKRHHKEIKGEP
jgi:hypothetical protein